MIVLQDTNDTIEVVLAGAVATSPADGQYIVIAVLPDDAGGGAGHNGNDAPNDLDGGGP